MGIDYQEMGRRIARRRKALGLRQAQVCEACDLNNNYLSNIEHAKSIPSLDVLLRICEALDTTPDVILLGTTQREQDGRPAQLAQRLKSLDQKQLSLLEHFLDWLTEQDL